MEQSKSISPRLFVCTAIENKDEVEEVLCKISQFLNKEYLYSRPCTIVFLTLVLVALQCAWREIQFSCKLSVILLDFIGFSGTRGLTTTSNHLWPTAARRRLTMHSTMPYVRTMKMCLWEC